jgi:hypothetical protein
MRSAKPGWWLRAAAIAAATAALPACNSGEGLVSLPNEDDASVSDAANETAAACSRQNTCNQNSDCLAATCDCGVAATDRCVNHCCLSVYAACLRACADAGDGATDAFTTGDDATDGATDAPTDS